MGTRRMLTDEERNVTAYQRLRNRIRELEIENGVKHKEVVKHHFLEDRISSKEEKIVEVKKKETALKDKLIIKWIEDLDKHIKRLYTLTFFIIFCMLCYRLL